MRIIRGILRQARNLCNFSSSTGPFEALDNPDTYVCCWSCRDIFVLFSPICRSLVFSHYKDPALFASPFSVSHSVIAFCFEIFFSLKFIADENRSKLDRPPFNNDAYSAFKRGNVVKGILCPSLTNSFRSRSLERSYLTYSHRQRQKSLLIVNIVDLVLKIVLAVIWTCRQSHFMVGSMFIHRRMAKRTHTHIVLQSIIYCALLWKRFRRCMHFIRLSMIFVSFFFSPRTDN